MFQEQPFQWWKSFGQGALCRLAVMLACTEGQTGALEKLVGNYVGVIMRYCYGSWCSFSDSKPLRFTLCQWTKTM